MRTSSSSYVWCIYIKILHHYEFFYIYEKFLLLLHLFSSICFTRFLNYSYTTKWHYSSFLEDYQFEVLLYLLNLYQYNQPHEKQQLILFLYLYQELHLLNRVLFCKDQETSFQSFLFFLLFC